MSDSLEKKREELLRFIRDLDDGINRLLEGSDVYGLGWLKRDWLSRRSILAGDLCLARVALEKAETKKNRSSRGSIGYRKAAAKARSHGRRIRKLEREIALPYEDYHVTEPEYFKTPVPDDVAFYEREPVRKTIHKRCDRLGYQSTSEEIYIIPLEGLDPID